MSIGIHQHLRSSRSARAPRRRGWRAAAAFAVAGALASACGGSNGGVLANRSTETDRTDSPTPDPTAPSTLPTALTLPTAPTPPDVSSAPAELPTIPALPVPPADPAPPDGTGATADAIAFQPVTFIDPASGGVPAITLLTPQGWQASGEVQWLPYWARLAFLQTRVVDPSTGLTIDWLPIQNFMYFTPPAGFDVPIGGNYQGKAYVPPITDPLQFVRDFWMGDSLAHLQGATVVSVQELPAIATDFVTQFGGPADAGAWRIRYEYESNGVMWEQDVSFALLWSGSDPVSWFVNYASTVGAPKGVLDQMEGLVSAVVASRTTTLEWEANYRIVLQLFYQGIQQQMADTVRFGELLAQYRAESQALQQQVFDERMASQDRQNEVFRETLGGVQGYDDPVNGGIVQLPLGWDTYWVNEQGEYLAVSDPNLDPNTLNDGTWTQLEPRA